MNVERPLTVVRPEAEIGPEAGRLHQDLGALVSQEVDVACRLEIPDEGEHHGGVDVVLRRAGRVVGRCLLAVDRAPRVERAALVEHLRPAAGGVEHPPPEAHHLPCGLGIGVGEERDDVDLGVPEVVTVVAAGGHRLGRHPLLMGSSRRLGQLEQVPPERLLNPLVAIELDVTTSPVVVEPLPLIGEQAGRSLPLGALQGPNAALGQLGGRDPSRRVIRNHLRDPDRLSGLGMGDDGALGQVVVEGGLDPAGTLGLDVIPVAGGEGHAAVAAAVAEDDAAVVTPGELRFEHSLGKLPGTARVDALAEGSRTDVVLIGPVLPVHQLGGHHDRGGGARAA